MMKLSSRDYAQLRACLLGCRGLSSSFLEGRIYTHTFLSCFSTFLVANRILTLHFVPKVCRMGCRSRHSAVNLPHGKSDLDSSDTGGVFAWLTIREKPRVQGCDGTHPQLPSAKSGVNQTSSTRNAGHTCKVGYADHAFRCPRQELHLSVGVLDWDLRGRCYTNFAREIFTPTHVIYAPRTRSIIVACRDNNFGTSTGIGIEGRDKTLTPHTSGSSTEDPLDGGKPRPSVLTPSSIPLSTLRVFATDTLKERPGGPLRLLPGLRITGITLLGVPEIPPTSKSLRTTRAGERSDRYGGSQSDRPNPAVGGDVVAVSCCRVNSMKSELDGAGGVHNLDANVAAPRWATAAGAADATAGGRTPEKDTCSLFSTVIMAFEVVAFGNTCIAKETCGEQRESHSHGDVPKVARFSDCFGRCVPREDVREETILAPLAASTGMAGACFCLESLGAYHVVAAIDDKVAIFGWNGRGSDVR